MTARRCFMGKVAAGKVNPRAAQQIVEMLDAFEAEHKKVLGDAAGSRQAAIEAAAIATADAERRADTVAGNIIAQTNILRTFQAYDAEVARLRETPGDLGFGNKAPPSLGKDQSTLGAAVRSLLARDPWEIGSTWSNVHYLARELRARAHAQFAEAIELLRPKAFGLKAEAARELDFLRAGFGRQDVDGDARAATDAWFKVNDAAANDFIDAGGVLTKKERYFPNPGFDQAKVRALGADAFKALARQNVDRPQMLDWATGKPLSDARFEQLLDEVTQSILAGGVEGLPSAAVRGRRMLAASRDQARFFVWKDAEAWINVAETVGNHASPFLAAIEHIDGITRDTAMLRVLGPNPEATKRFIVDLFEREPARLAVEAAEGKTPAELAAATKANRAAENQAKRERRKFEALWAEVSGANKIPVSVTLAQNMADVRSWLSATQMGSAIISSLTDPAMAAMAARFNGLPVMNVISRATAMMSEKGSEIFAAQQGVVLDSLAHVSGETDRIMGETIRTGIAAKLSSANIRISGLRRWSNVLRSAFALETMAHGARERGKAFAELDPAFRQALERYGIGAADWDAMRAVEPHEPRPGAPFLRVDDIREAGAGDVAEKWSRLIQTEMDYAVIEGDAVSRAFMLGQTVPGTPEGEFRRSVLQYKSFPVTFVAMHFARAAARGWDGSRLGHAALAFTAMTAFGALAMQTKEILAGRDPLTLDPTTGNGLRAWARASLQGGGLGVFGDILAVDQTKHGNSWAATLAGPMGGAIETLAGDFVIKQVQLAGKGEPSHFLGDALYTAGRYTPGSSLWFARLAFQRNVLDQLALQADPRAPERFARIEEKARKDWGQSYWWQPGRTEPRRSPELGAMMGAR